MGLGRFLSRLFPGRLRDEPSCEHLDMVQVLTTDVEMVGMKVSHTIMLDRGEQYA